MIDPPHTVVVVDDIAEVRSLVRTQLRLSGRYVVIGEGSTGRDAIELAASHTPDVLLLDVSMPDMGGLKALPRIRQVAPATQVVVYTGFDEAGLHDTAVRLGAAAIVQKGALVDRLADLLDAALYRAAAERGARPEPGAAAVSATTADDTHVLGEHLERFREVFEEAAIGMATMTLTGEIVRANKAFGRLLGHRVEELVGRSYLSLAPDADARSVSDALHRAAADTDIARFEHTIELPAGPGWVLATVAPVTDTRGRALYLFFQIQDVTEQRSTEEALRQSEERFGLLVAAVADYAIFMLDPDGRVASWNTGAQRIKGYLAAEIIGQHFRVFYPPDKQAARHPEHELELALQNGRYEEEGWRIRKDGTRFWASVVITAVFDRAGRHVGFAKVTRDVDERRQLLLNLDQTATALAQANQELEAANALLVTEAAEQAQFLAVTAHELRTPVTVLTGSANLLLEHARQLSDAERAELTESMGRGAQRLQRLLTDLLAVARLGSARPPLQPEPIAVDELLERVIAAARAAAPLIDISVQVEPDLQVHGEPDRLAQAVDNLIANAVQHGAAPIRVRATRRGDRVEIAVRDSGAGVADDVRPRLFQRFGTGADHGSTGLGLFIVRELARAHGGDAWYEPKPGPGSCFVLSLPASATPDGDRTRDSAGNHSCSGRATAPVTT